MTLKVSLLTAMTLLAFAGCKKDYDDDRAVATTPTTTRNAPPAADPSVSVAPGAGPVADANDKEDDGGDAQLGTAIVGSGKSSKLMVDLSDVDPGVYSVSLYNGADCDRLDEDKVPTPTQTLGELRVAEGAETGRMQVPLEYSKLKAAGFSGGQARVTVRESEDNDQDLNDGDIVACREVSLSLLGEG